MNEENGHAPQADVMNPFIHVAITPFSTSAGRINLPDGRPAVQIAFFHATGVTTLVCLPEEARQLANVINSNAGGLVVPVQDEKFPRPPA